MSGPAEQQQMLVYHYINFIDNWHSIPIFPHTESLFLSGLISKQSTDYHSTACALRYNSMCLTTPQYVPYICFAVVLCVKSFIGVWHFWHSLWWHYMRDAGHMKNRGVQLFMHIIFVRWLFIAEMKQTYKPVFGWMINLWCCWIGSLCGITEKVLHEQSFQSRILWSKNVVFVFLDWNYSCRLHTLSQDSSEI